MGILRGVDRNNGFFFLNPPRFENPQEEALYCQIHDRRSLNNVPHIIELSIMIMTTLFVLTASNKQNSTAMQPEHWEVYVTPAHLAVLLAMRCHIAYVKRFGVPSCWDNRSMLMPVWMLFILSIAACTVVWTRADQMREFAPELNPLAAPEHAGGFTGNALAFFRLSEMLVFNLMPNFLFGLGFRPRFDHMRIATAVSCVTVLFIGVVQFRAYIGAFSLFFRGVVFVSLQLMLLSCMRTVEQSARAEFRARRGGTDKHEQFLAMFSHELRTPLNGILGMMQMLQSPGMLEEGNETARSYTQMAIDSGSVLLRLVNDMLAYNVVKQTGAQLEVTPFSPRSMLQHVLVLMAGHIDERSGTADGPTADGAAAAAAAAAAATATAAAAPLVCRIRLTGSLELRLEVAPDVPGTILQDPARLSQILVNLLSNAMKATRKGCITLRCRSSSSGGGGGGGGVVQGQGRGGAQGARDGSSGGRADEAGVGVGAGGKAEERGGDSGASQRSQGGSSGAVPSAETASGTRAGLDLGLAGLTGRLCFEVEDTGCGMTPDTLAKAFDLFERKKAAMNAPSFPVNQAMGGGSGIGLCVCKQLVNAMGGELEGRSEVGTGSSFSFEVCCGNASEASAGGRENPHPWKELSELAAALPPLSAAREAQRRLGIRGRRVLLVEDEPFNAVVVTHFLADLGLEVTHAPDGEEAATLFEAALRGKEERFELVVMDVLLQKCDGYESTHRIRNSELAHHRATVASPRDGSGDADACAMPTRTPIIGLTAFALPRADKMCKACGMDYVMYKPVLRDAFAKLVTLTLSE